MKQIPVAQMLCAFACTQIFTVVFGLYYFGAIGATDVPCYYVKGSKVPMTLLMATKAAATLTTVAKPVVPENVTANFDYMMMLGFYSQVSMIAIPIAGLVLSKINAMLGTVVSGIGGCAAGVMGVMLYVCVFMYRTGEDADVCSGSTVKGNLTAAQKTFVMSSKGSFLMFMLVMQWIGVGCCALSCLCAVGRLIMAKASG